MTTDTPSYPARIARKLTLAERNVAATVQLLDEGNTLPFIARYRKEMTGGLDEEQIRAIEHMLGSLRALDERRATILASIREQEKLTPELEAQLLAAETLTALEDLYQPYRPKRRTRASIARERGLQPLADLILAQSRKGEHPETAAQAFLSDDVTTIDDALAGARDIVAETISDHAEVRRHTREKAMRFATLTATRIDGSADDKGVYSLYYDYSSRIDRLKPYQVLAINRGEAQKVLRVSVEIPERDWQQAIRNVFPDHPLSPWAEQLKLASDDGAKRLLLPAIERDLRATLTDQADSHAIFVFGANLRGLLTQPPLAGQVVLGLDPGFRTGCKVAVVDSSGKVLETATIYPHPPQKQQRESLAALAALVQRHGVTLISIGNGTASRETEQLVAELIKRLENGRFEIGSSSPATNRQSPISNLHYLIVNEAGASVYSASTLARAELPDLDVSLRGAVSIARRVQDPLAELVKIDPKSIGVGLYQHDVNQKELAGALDGVVESVVNRVGVDVNTASPALLTHVAGIGPKLAGNIVAHRDENGVFATRAALKKVTGLGPKAFEQSAGFLRVRGGDEALDSSAIHPESYAVARKVLKLAGITMAAPVAERQARLDTLRQRTPLRDLAAELETGEPTLADIFEQIVRPGRDPREDVPPPILRSDVLSMDDLAVGMTMQGTVRNVVDFGAFVDIGVKQDGLLHRSQIPRGERLSVGDIIDVEIASVDKERGRIGLGWPGKQAVDWAVG
ncbi:MAG: RNA-binding transcriptional accessory protein [Caldilinea sp.]|nr:RNA-binding transcriptional accessory protein [Caldilineaceae bacterium]MCB9120213.1 RNA-binding transcriptional accessory protein [Caldilineaceae bacterium]MCB9123815.1 RNA-binding transcriptional accessory protein [Caldilineaceae bacterium]MCW5845157.1 RNA-binding transcriptional accessory protein [Caldilinea sp.]